jgi:hypothetical protein
MADQLLARRWLMDLGRLTSVSLSQEAADSFVDTMAPMLAMRFPNEAFTPASLEAVAADCRYLPAYGELVPLLRTHWHQHRQLPPMLPAPPIRQRTEPTEEERAYVARVTAETIAAIRSSAQPVEERRPAARCFSSEQLVQAYRRAGVKAPARHA